MKTAVVTGGASGIGQGVVERLLSQGWTVWSLDVNEHALAEQGAKYVGAQERYQYHVCDVSKPESVSAAFLAIGKQTAKLDALICSAGVVRVGSMAEQALEEIDLMLAVNVRGTLLTVRAALALLGKQASVDNPSRVVILGSIGGIRPKVGSGFYSATKAAVHVLTGILAVELGPSGILVNAVAPGTVDTPMVSEAATANPSSGFKPSGVSPLGRIARPDDIVDVIDFFLGDASKYVNGTILPVDGGTRAAFVKS